MFPYIATYSVASIIGKPLIGQLSTRFGERATAVVYMLLVIPSTLLYTLVPSTVATVIGAVRLGLIANCVFGLVLSYLARRFPTAVRSAGMGTGHAIAGATGAVAPYVVAVFTHSWGSRHPWRCSLHSGSARGNARYAQVDERALTEGGQG